MRRWIGLIPFPAVAVLTITAACQTAAADTLDASIRHLRRAVIQQRDGSHLRLLLSLRQLRDPTLQPLFHQLAQHAEWQVQVHAILGLAEIDEDQRLDPWLVTRAAPAAQEQVIPSALDMDLIGPEEMTELLAWEDLPPLARVMLIGELLSLGEEPDLEELNRLAGSADPVKGMASCFLAQCGDHAAFSSYRRELSEGLKRIRQPRLLWIFDVIRQYRLTALLSWVRQVIEDPDSDEDVGYWGLFTILKLDPERGVPLWTRFLGDAPTHRKSVRFALLLMQAGPDVPSSAYDRLHADDELLERMIRAGKAVSSGEDATQPLIDLLEMGHFRSADWVLSTAPDLPVDQAARIYLHVIETAEADRPLQSERITMAKLAAARLFEIDRGTLLERLASAEDDSLTQQAILLGLFETRSAAAGEAAAKLRRIGAGRADSLTLLLIAKHAETLSEADSRQLGVIAAGGGRVSDVLQVQAAWLYLKLTNQLDSALSRILADRQ
ncbi:MAG: hypothetical protein JSV91_05505 [Phycisphaerales bacterium]|nr:MAG: hypothetical protein JSV91_05505 [Phycisphaerales bacterium]